MPTKTNAQSNKWSVIYNFQTDEKGRVIAPLDQLEMLFQGALLNFLDEYPQKFAYIVHDKDVNDDGTLKTPHVHLILWSGKRKLKSALLYDLSTTLEVNPNRLTISSIKSVESNLRYLLHLDSPEKCQEYLPSDIITNQPNDVDIALTFGGAQMSGEDLVDLIKRLKYDEREIAKYLGPSLYQRYFRFINLFTK